MKYTCIRAKFNPANGRDVSKGYTMLSLSDVEDSGRVYYVNSEKFESVGHESHGLGNFDQKCPDCFGELKMEEEIQAELDNPRPIYR